MHPSPAGKSCRSRRCLLPTPALSHQRGSAPRNIGGEPLSQVQSPRWNCFDRSQQSLPGCRSISPKLTVPSASVSRPRDRSNSKTTILPDISRAAHTRSRPSCPTTSLRPKPAGATSALAVSQHDAAPPVAGKRAVERARPLPATAVAGSIGSVRRTRLLGGLLNHTTEGGVTAWRMGSTF